MNTHIFPDISFAFDKIDITNYYYDMTNILNWYVEKAEHLKKFQNFVHLFLPSNSKPVLYNFLA